MWRLANPNPCGKNVGDCVIRALSIVLNKSWDDIYNDLHELGFDDCDMQNSYGVWTKYLKTKGFVPTQIENRMSVREVARKWPKGRYVLSTNDHVVAVIDGDYYDTWDSGNEIPLFMWKGQDSIMPYQQPYGFNNYGNQNQQISQVQNGSYQQNPYTNWYAQPQQMQPMQQPVVQQQSNGPQPNAVAWVQGEVGARAYPVAINQMMILMDSEDSCFYIKVVDAYGIPQPLRKFRFQEEPISNNKGPVNGNSDMYVTKEEFERKLNEKLEELTR
jgi:hypothetical protein